MNSQGDSAVANKTSWALGVVATPICNLNSVEGALIRYGIKYRLLQHPEEAMNCDRLLLPGVGHAAAGMKFLNDSGWSELLKQWQRPMMGICLGAQLMGQATEEGPTSTLGLMDDKVIRFRDASLRVPQMGWNMTQVLQHRDSLFRDLPTEFPVYYANSYYYPISVNTSAESTYGEKLSAVLTYNNLVAVQFHPERSGYAGERVIQNFGGWKC